MGKGRGGAWNQVLRPLPANVWGFYASFFFSRNGEPTAGVLLFSFFLVSLKEILYIIYIYPTETSLSSPMQQISLACEIKNFSRPIAGFNLGGAGRGVFWQAWVVVHTLFSSHDINLTAPNQIRSSNQAPVFQFPSFCLIRGVGDGGWSGFLELLGLRYF